MTTNNLTPDFIKAFVKVQAELPSIPKSSTNPHFKSKFASLDTFNELVLPVLHKHGFTMIQPCSVENDSAVIDTYLMHESGGYVVSRYLIGFDDNPQKQGARVTYGRRYAAFAILGVVGDEDDDGNMAAGLSGAKPTSTEPVATLKRSGGLRKLQ